MRVLIAFAVDCGHVLLDGYFGLIAWVCFCFGVSMGGLDTILSLVCCVVWLSCTLVCFPAINVGCDLLACRFTA